MDQELRAYLEERFGEIRKEAAAMRGDLRLVAEGTLGVADQMERQRLDVIEVIREKFGKPQA